MVAVDAILCFTYFLNKHDIFKKKKTHCGISSDTETNLSVIERMVFIGQVG